MEKLKWLHSKCQHEDTGCETIIPLWEKCPRRYFRYKTNWFRIIKRGPKLSKRYTTCENLIRKIRMINQLILVSKFGTRWLFRIGIGLFVMLMLSVSGWLTIQVINKFIHDPKESFISLGIIVGVTALCFSFISLYNWAFNKIR